MIALGLLYPAIKTIIQSFQDAASPTGSASRTTRRSSPVTTSCGAAQHGRLGDPDTHRGHLHRPDLRDPHRPLPVREVRQGAHLPADGDLARRRLGDLEVRLRLPRRRAGPDRTAQPDPQDARASTPTASCSTHRGTPSSCRDPDLGPGRVRDDDPLRRHQGDPRRHRRGGPSRRRQRPQDVPLHHRAEHPAVADRGAHHDLHHDAEGLRHRPDRDRRQFDTSVVAYEFYVPELPLVQQRARGRAGDAALRPGDADRLLQRAPAAKVEAR